MRQAKPVEGGPDEVADNIGETLQGCLAETDRAARKRLTATRKRVLRRRRRLRRRSVDSKQVGRVIEPRKAEQCGGRRRSTHGRQHRSTPWSWVRRLRRGRRTGHASEGTTGTWEISTPLVNAGAETRATNRGLHESRACEQEPTGNTKTARTQSTAERRRTKRRGTGDEKSETLVVPRKRGTRLTRTRGGKGRPVERLEQGKDGRDTGL